MISDLTIIGLFTIALLAVRNNQLQISLAAYCSTVFYACFLSADLPAWFDHVAYALICVPFILISTLKAAIGLSIYGMYHLVVAFDYILYPKIDTIISNSFEEVQFFIAFCLITLSINRGYNGYSWTPLDSIMDRIFNLWRI